MADGWLIGDSQHLSFDIVSSLLEMSLLSVVKQLPNFINDLEKLPTNVREKLLNLISKRGLITDDNLPKVVHSQVKMLDLSESRVTDNAFDCLKHCQLLKKIDLNSAKENRTEITSVGVEKLALACKNLQALYLRRCVKITDTGVKAVAQHCPQLQELNIGGCTLLTDVSLQALGKNAKCLKNIRFSSTNVTDQGVIDLVSGDCNQSLEEIHMDSCKSLTDDSVEAVCLYCQHISILLFHGCPRMTVRSRRAMDEMASQHRIHQFTWTIY